MVASLAPHFFVFQSTLPVWGATDGALRSDLGGHISIHAPRVGSDYVQQAVGIFERISIHAPRVGSDGRAVQRGDASLISIHAPRVGSDLVRSLDAQPREISIHAPRVGSDSL